MLLYILLFENSSNCNKKAFNLFIVETSGYSAVDDVLAFIDDVSKTSMARRRVARKFISLDLIRLDFQRTEPLDTEVVSRYVQELADGKQLKPITLLFGGKAYWLADGFHR